MTSLGPRETSKTNGRAIGDGADRTNNSDLRFQQNEQILDGMTAEVTELPDQAKRNVQNESGENEDLKEVPQ